jgi:hypothetical protein
MQPFDESRRRRSVFTAIEDELLESLVQQFGFNSWNLIATNLPGRSPRQCRERWFTYLSPDINRTPWRPEEDGLLFDLMQIHGPRWGSIAGFFCNRTQNNVKNRWNTITRKALAMGVAVGTRMDFIQTGQKIASRSTRKTFEPGKQPLGPRLPDVFRVENLLNAK